MKKFSLLAVAIATLGMFVATTGSVSAQESAPSTPHQIGLIDMAYIFKNYTKFKDETTQLQKAAEEAEGKAQQFMEKGRQMQAQLQTLQPGSADYNKVESDLIKLKTELESFKQVEQREIVRKQAEVYKAIYLEVQDMVQRFATYHKYTLVIRFTRDDVSEASNPQAIIQNMNRQVVFYQDRDDITEPILKYLNDRYKQTASAK